MDTQYQTFRDNLTTPKRYDKIKANNGWLICPACGQWKVLRLLPETEAKNLIVYCKRCHRESVVNILPECQRQ